MKQRPEDVFSKRPDQIRRDLAKGGWTSYRARRIAALRTRPPIQDDDTGPLMPRWRAELEAAGFSIAQLNASINAAGAQSGGLAPSLTDAEINQLAAEIFDPDGSLLTRHRTFLRHYLVAEVAPKLYGHNPAELDPVIDHLLASPNVVPLPPRPTFREQAYTVR